MSKIRKEKIIIEPLDFEKLSGKTKRNIRLSEGEIRDNKTFSFEEIKKKMKMRK